MSEAFQGKPHEALDIPPVCCYGKKMTPIADRPNNYAHYLNYRVYRKQRESELAALLPVQ